MSKPLESWKKLNQAFNDSEELAQLSDEDESIEEEIRGELSRIDKGVASFELASMLSGKHDPSNAIVSINAGAGGTEAQDWAEMVMRMYLRWAEHKGFKADITDYQPGEEAGLKGATMTISGDYAYGYLKAENGIHRLVRISPFDANKRRHTSFCSVFVSPELDNDIIVDINEEDLRIDTYRSSGAGGQHVNVTDSAVRITHIPTNTIAQCQNERSQHKNKATAMKVLRSKLYELERLKHEETAKETRGEKKEIGWGSQIRSYVLHPYRMIKDLRTRHETGNTEAVFDGEIDDFIEAYLLMGRDRGKA